MTGVWIHSTKRLHDVFGKCASTIMVTDLDRRGIGQLLSVQVGQFCHGCSIRDDLRYFLGVRKRDFKVYHMRVWNCSGQMRDGRTHTGVAADESYRRVEIIHLVLLSKPKAHQHDNHRGVNALSHDSKQLEANTGRNWATHSQLSK